MTDRHAVNRPDCEKAHSVSAALCEDPGCGLHLIAWRSNDQPICEIVMGRNAVRELLDLIHEHGLDL